MREGQMLIFIIAICFMVAIGMIFGYYMQESVERVSMLEERVETLEVIILYMIKAGGGTLPDSGTSI